MTYTVRNVSSDRFEKFMVSTPDKTLAKLLFDHLITYAGDKVTLEAAGQVIERRGHRKASK